MIDVVLLLHVLAATVWTGGHLVLAIGVLPRALRAGDATFVDRFEQAYEPIGVPALVVQLVTGPLLAYRLLPDVAAWVDLGDPVGRLVACKLALLATTAVLAIHARLKVVPHLATDPARLRALAWHTIPVTLLAVGFVVVGVLLGA